VEVDALRRAALVSLIHQCVKEQSELTVVVTDDESLRDLNFRHRGIDAPTDVLAFSNENQGPFVGAPGLPRYLGDIVISFQRAEAQAAHAGHAVQAELQLLVVHGVLHLLGYDDVAEEQRARMWEAQAAILTALGVDLQLPA
jgi:probable rRNA maturation factor